MSAEIDAACGAGYRERFESLVQALGIEKLSKSTVSELDRVLDAFVKSFRARRIVNLASLVAVRVNDDGRRRSWALKWSRPRMARAGWPSCAACERAA